MVYEEITFHIILRRFYAIKYQDEDADIVRLHCTSILKASKIAINDFLY